MGFNPLVATTRRPGSGESGRGIVRITFKSSSLGDEPAISGAVDTYEILYTDNTSEFFQVRNGKDGESPIIDVKTENNQIIFNVINGDSVQQTIISTSEFSSVQTGMSLENFPEEGQENMIYLDSEEGELYYYKDGKYKSINAGGDFATSEEIKNLFK